MDEVETKPTPLFTHHRKIDKIGAMAFIGCALGIGGIVPDDQIEHRKKVPVWKDESFSSPFKEKYNGWE